MTWMLSGYPHFGKPPCLYCPISDRQRIQAFSSHKHGDSQPWQLSEGWSLYHCAHLSGARWAVRSQMPAPEGLCFILQLKYWSRFSSSSPTHTIVGHWPLLRLGTLGFRLFGCLTYILEWVTVNVELSQNSLILHIHLDLGQNSVPQTWIAKNGPNGYGSKLGTPIIRWLTHMILVTVILKMD